MFRFLLEAYENLAYFTTLEKKTAMLKLIFASESKPEVLAALADIARTISLKWEAWPLNAMEKI